MPRHLTSHPPILAVLVLCWTLTAVALSPAPAAHAQEAGAETALPSRPDDQPRGSFGEAIEVRLIDVEVVVTDGQGRRVSGLTRDDFKLLVGGQEVPIAFFDEVRDGNYVPEGAAVAEAGTEGEGAAPPATTPPVETSYLLFLDDYFTRPPYRNLVLKGLAKDLAGLGPNDRFAAVSYDGKRLEVLTDWTQDAAEIEEVLTAARKRDGWQAFLEQQRFRSGPRGATADDLRSNRQGMSRLMAAQLGRTYKALSTALRTFADVPGRRVALVVAGGWPYELTIDGFQETLGRSLLFDVERPLQRVADVANATGFTLYPIDAPGPEQAGGGADSLELATETGFGFAAEGQLEERSLMILAERTGGEALLDGQRLNALGTVLVDTRSYYWLSFSHQRRGDGGVRSIRVEVDRPGLKVRSRQGFLDLSQGAEAEMKAERALLLGEDVEPTLEVEIGPTQRAGRRMDVPFAVMIPVPEISTVPLPGGGGRAELELRIAVEDAKGDRAEIDRQQLDLPLSAAMLEMEAVAFEAAVRIRRKPHVLVFVLNEPATGRTWLARHEVRPDD